MKNCDRFCPGFGDFDVWLLKILSLFINKHFRLRGGYAGFGEPDPNIRDFELYETIPSGDLDSNDIQVYTLDLLSEPTRAENSYNVVKSNSTDTNTILDGFTTTGGNADVCWPTSFHCSGGGLYTYQGSLTITNCTFTRNSAGYYGGGLYGTDCSMTLTECIFIDNRAADFRHANGKGGGIYLGNASAELTSCSFTP